MALPPRLLLHGTIEAKISHAENTYDPTRVTGWLPFGIGDVRRSILSSSSVLSFDHLHPSIC